MLLPLIATWLLSVPAAECCISIATADVHSPRPPPPPPPPRYRKGYGHMTTLRHSICLLARVDNTSQRPMRSQLCLNGAGPMPKHSRPTPARNHPSQHSSCPQPSNTTYCIAQNTYCHITGGSAAARVHEPHTMDITVWRSHDWS